MGAIVSGGSSTRSSTCTASSAASASSFMRCFSSASAGFGGTSPVIAATSSANLESDGFGGLAGDPSSSSFDDDPGVSSSLADASAHTRLLTRHLAASTDTPRHEDGAHRLGRQATAAIRPTAVDLTARDSVMRGNASRCLRPSRGFRPPTAGALLAAHPDGASDAISPHLFERACSPAMTAGALAGEINNPQTRAIFFERECRWRCWLPRFRQLALTVTGFVRSLFFELPNPRD